jgi:hypothetical protein
VAVYYKGQRMGEARLLDAIANNRKPSTDPSTTGSHSRVTYSALPHV